MDRQVCSPARGDDSEPETFVVSTFALDGPLDW